MAPLQAIIDGFRNAYRVAPAGDGTAAVECAMQHTAMALQRVYPALNIATFDTAMALQRVYPALNIATFERACREAR